MVREEANVVAVEVVQGKLARTALTRLLVKAAMVVTELLQALRARPSLGEEAAVLMVLLRMARVALVEAAQVLRRQAAMVL